MIYRRHAADASQRYEAIMLANAARVLAEAYTPIFGGDAPEAAQRIVTHMMHKQPVQDRAGLVAMGDTIVRLQRAFFAARPGDAADIRLIRWETARRWAAVSRASLRAGTITLTDALAIRPDHLGLSHAGFDELLRARLIGRSCAALTRARQTFAA